MASSSPTRTPRKPAQAGRVALVAPTPLDLPLDPARLAPHAENAMGALLAEGESENTVRSYQTAIRYWAAWFELRFGQPIALPLPVAAVVQFIVDHAERKSGTALLCELPESVDRALVESGHKAALGAPALSTVVHRISVLSKAHQIAGQANPCLDAKVRELMSRTRRAYAKRGVVQDKKAALTREPLQALLATCDDSLRGLRDRALILFAWSSGGRRRSEVTTATLDNVRKVAERTYIYALHHSKTNQAGWSNKATDKPIVGPAADALDAWLMRSGIRDGAIFRRIRKGGQVAEPLSPAAVRDIIKARSLLAGLPEDYSAHSLRSGFVTEAARQQVSIGETMALTGHASVASVVGYFRTAAATDSKAARLLDGDDV
jgi:integrase